MINNKWWSYYVIIIKIMKNNMIITRLCWALHDIHIPHPLPFFTLHTLPSLLDQHYPSPHTLPSPLNQYYPTTSLNHHTLRHPYAPPTTAFTHYPSLTPTLSHHPLTNTTLFHRSTTRPYHTTTKPYHTTITPYNYSTTPLPHSSSTTLHYSSHSTIRPGGSNIYIAISMR